MTTDAPENEETSETAYDIEPAVPDTSGSGPAGPEPRPSGSGGGNFIKRLVLAFIKVTVALLIIAALAFGAWIFFIEINRSFDSVVTRIERNTRRIEETEAEIDALQEQNYARQVQTAELEAAVATREAEIVALEEELGAGLEQQREILTAVEEEVAALAERADALGSETTVLGAGLVALQQDLTANGQQIDQLGGTLDGLSAALQALDGQTADLQSQVDTLADEELAGWRRAVALFRVWEMISRARLRLFEGNYGLAAADIELAITAVDTLTESDAEQTPAALTAIRERLLLAAASLPDQPQVAARDLETAWEALDTIVAQALSDGANGE